MNNRLFTMGVMVFIFVVLVVCFDVDGRYIQQLMLFWAGAVFGALLMGGMNDEEH
jgi:prepilin signal peptidase PulO-like enzyme (type II secretory pathway)